MLKHLQYTLQDNFEKNGLWWLPSEPKNKVGGLLRYRFGMAPRLELTGTLRLGSLSYDSFEADIIQGVTSDGIFCTLCRSVGITNGSSPGFIRQDFNSQWLLLGHHFETLDEVQFDSHAVNFQYMEEWLFRAPHAADRKHDEGEVVFNIRWPARNLLDKELLLTGGKLSLIADPHIANFSNIAINIQSIAYLKWEPESAKSLSQYISLFFDVQHFFSLLFGESTFPRRIIGYLKKKKEEKEIDWPVSIYYDHQPAIFNPPELSNYYMLVSYDAMKDRWVSLLDNWLSKADDFRSIYSLFFGFLSKPDMYPHNGFLNLVQSLEIYHRVVVGGKFVPKAEYKRVRKQLNKFINTITPVDKEEKSNFKDLKEALKLKLQYGNEFFLSHRLTEILNGLSGELSVLVTDKEVDIFAKEIARTRNDLVHEGKTQNMDHKEVIVACQRLRILITILLLKRLGLEDTLIKESIARNRRIQPYEI